MQTRSHRRRGMSRSRPRDMRLCHLCRAHVWCGSLGTGTGMAFATSGSVATMSIAGRIMATMSRAAGFGAHAKDTGSGVPHIGNSGRGQQCFRTTGHGRLGRARSVGLIPTGGSSLPSRPNRPASGIIGQGPAHVIPRIPKDLSAPADLRSECTRSSRSGNPPVSTRQDICW